MGTPLRVLIVEDSQDDTTLLVRELQRGGYDPTFERVDTYAATKAALQRQAWDIVISDYTMPQFGGLEALDLMQQLSLDLPFIIVSGSIGEDIAVTAMKTGAHDYIMKGNTKRLLPAVERELRESEMRRERKRAEEQLRQSEERFRQLAENINEVFFLTGPAGTPMIYISPAYESVWGRARQTLYADSLSWLEGVHPEDRPRVEVLLRNSPENFQTEYRIVKPDGSARWIWARTFPIRDQRGTVYRLAWVAEDITERKQAEEMIQHMAFYDTLTSLPNRNMLMERLRNAIRDYGGQGQRMALLMMDLDRFREINDTLGHHRGDLLLQQVGRRLRETIFVRDVVARLGGDEFAVLLLKLTNEGDIQVAIEKITEALKAPFVVEDVQIAVETSIGVALYPSHGTDPDTLIQRADVALYTAKKSGTGYALYTAELDRHSPQRLALMAELRQAIEQNQLVLHYQPKVILKDQKVFGVEALVRWKHPQRGTIMPDEFIGPAEQTGLIHPLAHWVLKEAMGQCSNWQKAGLEVAVSINLSARNLLDPKLPERVVELLQTSGVSPDRIQFEITESAIMTDPTHAQDILMKLHGIGIKISIDDFGIGYSSLSYLRKLPVVQIKVDKSFVINMTQNEGDAKIVYSTIQLAHNLGLEVVAEGVETQEILDRLIKMGCDAAQGYYISRPIPAEELTRWLNESPWGLKRACGDSIVKLS